MVVEVMRRLHRLAEWPISAALLLVMAPATFALCAWPVLALLLALGGLAWWVAS